MITYIHNCTKFVLLSTSNRVLTWTFYLLCLGLHTDVCLSERCDTVLYLCFKCCIYRHCQLLSSCSVCDRLMQMCMERWWNYADRRAAKYSEKNPPQRHFVNHKSHVSRPGTQSEPTRPSSYGLSVFHTGCKHDVCCFLHVNYLQISCNLSWDANSVPYTSPSYKVVVRKRRGRVVPVSCSVGAGFGSLLAVLKVLRGFLRPSLQVSGIWLGVSLPLHVTYFMSRLSLTSPMFWALDSVVK